MPDVMIQVEGAVGRISLNRPEALNALTHQMCLDIEDALLAWQGNDNVEAVLIEGAGPRAFCAGGDITKLYAEGRAGNLKHGRQFWRDEYRLNALIAEYPKPYVAIMHGFVMGGGVGLSAHGSLRIVTDSTQLAMPECAIGLVPDVGGTYLLGKASNRFGEFLGLTGTRIAAADCIMTGFADLYISEERLQGAIAGFIESGNVEALNSAASKPTVGQLETDRAAIETCFSAGTIAEIVDAVERTGGAFAANTLKRMSHGAPLALATTLEMIGRARAFNALNEALKWEYRLVSRAVEQTEFLEGIRAAVIDKDRAPRWRYATHADVPQDLLAEFRKPAPDGDLEL